MSAAKPSPSVDTALVVDEWDSLLTPASSGSASSPPSLLPSSSSSSGEFRPFSFVGAALAGRVSGTGSGGPAAGTGVFCLLKDDPRCLGSITGGKFCLKLCDGEDACNVPTHSTRKAKLQIDHFYVKETDSKAFCEPKLSMILLSDKQREHLHSLNLTKDNWVQLFLSVEKGELAPWFPGDLVLKDMATETQIPSQVVDFTLASPRAADLKTGVFGIFPALSYEDDHASNSDREDEQDNMSFGEVISTVKDFKHRFGRIKNKWTSAFQDIKVGHLMVTSDIERLGKLIQDHLGVPSQGTVSHTNVWEALAYVASTMQQGLESAHLSLTSFSEKFDDIVSNQMIWQTEVDTKVISVQDTLKRHESRFSKILPILMHVQRSPTTAQAAPVGDVTTLQEQVAALTASVTALQEAQWHSTAAAPPGMLQDQTTVDETLRDLQAQVKLLQVRIVGSGVQIGGVVFQCFDDVRSWVTAKFQIRRYGLFVDGVSLLDFFSFVSHVDTEKSVSAFYNQQKSGFVSMYEARVASSTQNLFPMVFGRSTATGMDDSEYLPALQDPDKWDNGITGLRYQINRGMSDVEFQLESSIDTILRDYPEPRQIAKDCLYKAKRFVTDLCNFITQDYQKWQHRGHGKKESWRMTTVCVRRIFEEIHSQRVVARDILDVNDADFTCAKFLWATWKAHDTMSLYVRHQFYEHPSIAAVLARHLADNHVKPDAASSTKLNSLEKAIKNINGRLDSFQATSDRLERDFAQDIKTLQFSVSRLDKELKDPSRGDGKGGKYRGKKDKPDKEE